MGVELLAITDNSLIDYLLYLSRNSGDTRKRDEERKKSVLIDHWH